MQAVIVAGGKGTRLRSRLGDLPKPMADIGGEPLIQRQIELLAAQGFREAVLLLGYNPDPIRRHLGDGSDFGIRIRHVVEDRPLGSAGAVFSAWDSLEDRFAVLYADTMLNVDLARFAQIHAQSNAAATLLLHPNDHPHDSDLVEVDDQGRIRAFHPYPHTPGRFYQNLVNAALYFVEKSSLARWRDLEPPLDFAKNIFPKMLSAGQHLHGYRSREYIKDAGTPERLDHVTADYVGGKVARGSFAYPAPAVFLDRDGTINEEVNRVKSPHEFRLLPGVAGAIRKVNMSEYKAVVVTNQPVVARGDCTEEGLQEIHNKMETELGRASAFVDAIYYCPHHPDKGYEGERPELKFQCRCRKPGIAMIERARSEMNLDLSRSWMIGDSVVDLLTARNAGIRSILVETGQPFRPESSVDAPDYRFSSLGEAVDFVLAQRES